MKKLANNHEETTQAERASESENTSDYKRAIGCEKTIRIERSPLTYLVDAALSIEKLRVASQVRQTHLGLKDRVDRDTNEVCDKLIELEGFVDGRVAKLITEHPAYPWFSKVKGVGRENIGKVVAPIDIERANTISALWSFAGFGVVDGKAPKRQSGEKLHYNSQLRSMCWRLASSLRRAKGVFYDYCVEQKALYMARYSGNGHKVVSANQLPLKNGKRYESEDMISLKHVDNMAVRKMIKLFLACLWLVWREAVNLPITKPYAIDKLGHNSFIDPWKMTDRE